MIKKTHGRPIKGKAPSEKLTVTVHFDFPPELTEEQKRLFASHIYAAMEAIRVDRSFTA